MSLPPVLRSTASPLVAFPYPGDRIWLAVSLSFWKWSPKDKTHAAHGGHVFQPAEDFSKNVCSGVQQAFPSNHPQNIQMALEVDCKSRVLAVLMMESTQFATPGYYPACFVPIFKLSLTQLNLGQAARAHQCYT